ncbi:hypothetical protein CYMTET_47640 [Cymbomonas tetramitiformis]|uniref:Uncharacterized protein n=1 Tax=Cymbomonas tetramitiformis TaxID=36881 RepID=A0AAE0EVS5_9CHLO|nr:hypothetical protein CYMTET_47640 [Cymbomonas tetramitiformis]
MVSDAGNTTTEEEEHRAWNAVMLDELAASSTFCVEGVHYVLRYPGHGIKEQASSVARGHCECKSCTSRAKRYVGDAGPEGALFLANTVTTPSFAQLSAHDQAHIVALRKLAVECCSPTQCPANPTPIIVTEDTYEPPQLGSRGDQQFIHWTIRPDNATAPEKAAHFHKLRHYLSQMDVRLSKLTEPEAVKSVEIMEEERPRLARAGHWASAIRRWTLEAYYMVSQLNRRLNLQSVTSPHIIGLTWDGKFTDDLDLHVITPKGSEVYFGNKEADGCRLDFDANVTEGEAEPCENVSVRPGVYNIYVTNFTKRTRDSPIPFQIVCRTVGKPHQIYPGVGTHEREERDKIHVCAHTLTDEPLSPEDLELSEEAARRASAQAADTDECVGVPASTVATVTSVEDRGMLLVLPEIEKVRTPANTSLAESDSANLANISFQQMLKPVTQARVKKKFLTDNCRQLPSTFTEVVELMKSGKHALSVRLRDHSPEYLVDITTTNAYVRRNNLPAACHFKDKFAPPHRQMEVGNARLDDS